MALRVLVTGGAGFIGSHVTKELAHRGHETVIVDDFSSGRIDSLSDILDSKRIQIIRGDIRERRVVENCTKYVDSIVHLAAKTNIPASIEYPRETMDVNVNGTANLVSACADREVDTFVLASSCAVYGEAQRLPIPEKHPLDPLSPYATSKVLAERECAEKMRERGLRSISLRLFNVYGGRTGNGGEGNVVNTFARKIVEGETPIIYGDGNQTRDFIHVDDVTQAICNILESSPLEGVCNLGTGISTTINGLAQKMTSITGSNSRTPQHVGSRFGDVRHSQADTALMTKALAFVPRTNLEEGLSRVLGIHKRAADPSGYFKYDSAKRNPGNVGLELSSL